MKGWCAVKRLIDAVVHTGLCIAQRFSSFGGGVEDKLKLLSCVSCHLILFLLSYTAVILQHYLLCFREQTLILISKLHFHGSPLGGTGAQPSSGPPRVRTLSPVPAPESSGGAAEIC